MMVTCSCGKKILFGEGEEERACDRCGQTVKASGVEPQEPLARPPARPRGAGPRRGTGVYGPGDQSEDEPAAYDLGPEPEPAPAPQPMPAQRSFSSRFKILLRRRRGPWRRLGCLGFLIALLGAAAAADYYLVNPPGGLLCGHVGKAAYLFGMAPFGHDCEGARALRYLDRARRAVVRTDVIADDFEELAEVPSVGAPPGGTPYEFTVQEWDHLAADPVEPETGLYHYLVSPDGTVYCERHDLATIDSETTGTLAP